MRRSAMRRGAVLVVALAVGCGGAAAAQAPSAEGARPAPLSAQPVPRLANGKPDLTGVWLKRLNNEGRNSALGAEPLPFTPEGRARYDEARKGAIDPTSACRLPGTPRVNNSPYPFQIVQRPEQAVFVYEYMHNFRVIPTDGRGLPREMLPQLMGTSAGRWEGDTLVIESAGFTDRTWLDDFGNQHSDQMRLTEQWTRVSFNQLRYQFTLTDPKYYTKPWSNGWMMALASPDVYVMEYACTDFNKSFDDGLVGPGAR